MGVLFEPIIDEDSQLLILGTYPGKESLRLQQYYADRRNKFWEIIFGTFGSIPSDNYNAKVSFLKRKGIAIWDVYQFVERKSSLDKDTKYRVPNDFEALLRTYPNLKYAAFNGRSPYDGFVQCVPKATRDLLTGIGSPLQSSSGANAKSVPVKIEDWKRLLLYLGEVR